MKQALIRINAFLASAGLGSRRSVEELVLRGKIQVNREIIHDLSFRVDPEKDVVLFQGKEVRVHQYRYIALNKPPGYVCTKEDRHALRTIYDLLPRELQHLNHVGRLDTDSEGLLLLSNDGPWVNRILHPSNEIQKIYEVEVRGHPTEAELERAVRGVYHQGELLKMKSFRSLSKKVRSSEWEIILQQGRKREIRRIFDTIGYRVERLKRVSIGELPLGSLKVGKWRELTAKERSLFES
jgi:23S rRNA pseudouridine2605 synthase